MLWLDDLWIDPDWMGQGIGRLLFQHAEGQARRSGATRMEWEAEPNAIAFYEKMGGRCVVTATQVFGAAINPVMGLDLT